MTSSASQQILTTASTTSSATPSYASAAGAPITETTQASLNASRPQPNVAAGSPDDSQAQNAEKPSVHHLNVTMAANAPNSFPQNGGPINGAKNIQFGFDASPAPSHSTPQAGNAAPIPIPGGNSGNVPSPAASPAPIPQPSASGGPPRGQQAGGPMVFGSLGSDGGHMRQGSAPNNNNPSALGQPQGTHFRRESGHSASGEGRGSFSGGRGRGFNPQASQYNGQAGGYPPQNQFRNGPQQHGRGGMAPSFQPQGQRMGYPSSPQPARVQPSGSMPGTPNMQHAAMNQGMPMNTPPHQNQYYGAPPMGPQHPQNYGYPPASVDGYGRPISMPYGGYQGMPYMAGPPQANSPSFNQFAQPVYHQPGHSMSRTNSQAERPSSANQNAPMVVSGTPQGQNAQPATPGSSSFVKPRKSAAIQIKNAQGEIVDMSGFKTPASPAPTGSTKTPPVAATATPPPKPATPTHARAESTAPPAKTVKEIQEELRNKIKAAQVSSGESATEKEAEKPAAAETKAEEAPKATEPAKTEAASAAKESEKPAEAEKPTEADKPAETEETEDERIERMIREMEEEDARREKEAEEYNKQKKAAAEAKKAEEEKNKTTSAADEDAKLKAQEREMERLEEEKEKKRAAGGKTLSVAELLAGKAAPAEEKVDDVADKLADLNIDGDKSADKPTTAEKRGLKPNKLDLAPLNTKPVEPAQPSAALQSLKSARFLTVMNQEMYPEGIKSPNPSLNAAVAQKGKTFHYDANFLLQFQKVFTEKPSVEFDQQVKSLMGDSEGRSASNRAQTPGSARGRGGGASGFGGSMGTFNAPPGRTLPSGTTSADRFAMSSGSMSRPGAPNPMASFGGPGSAFPGGRGGGGMSRSSSNNVSSSRQSNSSRRGNSRRGPGFDPKEAQAAKTMPLTAGKDLKPIEVTSSGWKPTSLGKGPGAAAALSGYMEPDMVQRKVKASLNKMTPEKFDKIADQILDIASQSKDETDGRTLRQVIQLTFEKATDEAHWASMYAKFCKRMLETISAEVRDENVKDKNGAVVSGGNLFRKYLLNRCQEEFETGWIAKKPKGDDSTEQKADGEEKKEEPEQKALGDTTMLSDDYYKLAAEKRRGLGLVQFIGELFKLGMLTERIMHQCVQRLVDYNGVPDEAEIESLCKLLRTIGYNLDQTERGHGMMDIYFSRIQAAVEMPELPSRMKFMLMDIVDLRRANWISKDGNKGPKTLDEVRAEAEAAQAAKAQESARNNQRGGGGGRPAAGRGDARNFSAGYQQQQNNQVGLEDLRRLKSASRTSSQNITLGPGASMFSSRSNSGRRLGGPGSALNRTGDDSGNTSRTGTPPARENSRNAFALLASTGDEENPASPPTNAVSPAISKATPAESDKKEGE